MVDEWRYVLRMDGIQRTIIISDHNSHVWWLSLVSLDQRLNKIRMKKWDLLGGEKKEKKQTNLSGGESVGKGLDYVIAVDTLTIYVMAMFIGRKINSNILLKLRIS